jgi:hypothetical protein
LVDFTRPVRNTEERWVIMGAGYTGFGSSTQEEYTSFQQSHHGFSLSASTKEGFYA